MVDKNNVKSEWGLVRVAKATLFILVWQSLEGEGATTAL